MIAPRTLLLEPYSGISGDMFVGAAAPLAGCEDEVVALPARLGLEGVTCRFGEVLRGGLHARKFDVYGPGGAEDFRERAGSHAHGPHAGHPSHASLRDILQRIASAGLDTPVAERARDMFVRLGHVEAEAHGIPLDQVHFHEVGAVDSLIDIVGAALCIERLNISAAVSTPVCTGHGDVATAHGRLPVPAPATERLLQGMPTSPGTLEGEWTTPTGALILGALKPSFDAPVLVTAASCYGAGGRDPAGRPNVLRLRLCTAPRASLDRDAVCVLRCNLDDAPGEHLGADFVASLLDAGALDVAILPALMKKGRPGHMLEVLAPERLADDIGLLLLATTRSIGVRVSRAERLTLPRETLMLETPYGPVRAKRVRLPDGRARVKPEHEDCRARAAEHGAAVQDVHAAALAAAAAL